MSLFEYQSKLYPHEKYQLYLAVLNLYGLERVAASCAERLFKEQIDGEHLEYGPELI